MTGQTSRRVAVLPVTLLAAAVLLMYGGCSSSSDVSDRQQAKPMKEHEKTFDPAKYRKKPAEDTTQEPAPVEATKTSTEPRWIEHVEKTMGFRIQLYTTTSIDDAQRHLHQLNIRLDSLDIPSGRLDMSFDAPYYKLRMGDFLQKSPADSLRDVLREHGLHEAWVVRDRVNTVVRERK